MNYKCSIDSYFEETFKQIMEADGISPEDLLDSLAIVKNHKMVFRAGEGAGGSGSFFFFSYDNRFLIKTLQGEEKSKILNVMNNYQKHLKESNNMSLLARIYGIFTFQTN